MARTVEVIAPPGMTSPELKFYTPLGVIIATIAVTALNQTSTLYTGTLPVGVTASLYTVELAESGGAAVGAWTAIESTGVDPENILVRDATNDLKGVHTEQQYTRTNQAGDTLTETIAKS